MTKNMLIALIRGGLIGLACGVLADSIEKSILATVALTVAVIVGDYLK